MISSGSPMDAVGGVDDVIESSRTGLLLGSASSSRSGSGVTLSDVVAFLSTLM